MKLQISDLQKDCLYAGLIIFLGWSLYLVNLGSIPFWDPWEPKYAQAVREMMERGDYITPVFNKDIRWTKPIFIYWAIFPFTFLLGINELACRFPGALSGIGGLLIVYYTLSRLKNRETGLITAFILGTFPQYVFLSRQLMPDMLLTTFLTGGMCSLALARFGNKRNFLFYILFYVFISLAFLTKGPLALAIAGISVIFYMVLCGDYQLIRESKVYWGALIFILVNIPWYGAMLLRYGNQLVEKFFGSQNIGRFTETVAIHKGTFVFYISKMLYSTYPWSGLVILSLLGLVSWRKFFNKNTDDETRERIFFMCWFIACFTLFTYSATKLPHYFLPALPILAIMAGIVIEDRLNSSTTYRFFVFAFVWIILTVLLMTDLVKEPKLVLGTFTVKTLVQASNPAKMIQITGWLLGIALLLLLVLRKYRYLALAVLVLPAWFLGLYNAHHLVPRETIYKTLKPYVDYYNDNKRPGDILILYSNSPKFTINYYTNNNFIHILGPDFNKLAEVVRKQEHPFIIVNRMLHDKMAKSLPLLTGKEFYDHLFFHPDVIMMSMDPPPNVNNKLQIQIK